MIITVTMNPAVDKTAETESIAPGGLNRLRNVVTDAGGKGINVSKMLAALGAESIAAGFLGGGAGREIEELLRQSGIRTDFTGIRGTTRTNLKVLTVEHGITEFNEPGAEITAREMDALNEKLLSYAGPGVMYVFAGSLPRGAGAGVYFALIRAVKEKGASAFLDADGEAFAAALRAKPDYIKPNVYELTQYFGTRGEETARARGAGSPPTREADTPPQVRRADTRPALEADTPPKEPGPGTRPAREAGTPPISCEADTLPLQEYAALCRRLIDIGIRVVTLSMGKHGALFVTSGETLYAPGLPVQALSTVGAGDCMVGALAYAFERGMRLRDAAVLAMAASAGAVTTRGTKPPTRETVESLRQLVKLETL